MGKLLQPLILIALALAVPIVPFVFWGDRLETQIGRQLEGESTAGQAFVWVVGLLATDIVMPIPSSLVSTYGGARLGWLMGTFASWLGMTCGASAGFALARRWGRPVALWFARESDLDGMQRAVKSWGAMLLVATRALPVVAEASVLLFGMNRLSWNRFLPPVLLSNLGIAVAYSALGDVARQNAWLSWALAVSLALPFLVAVLVRRYWLLSRSQQHSGARSS